VPVSDRASNAAETSELTKCSKVVNEDLNLKVVGEIPAEQQLGAKGAYLRMLDRRLSVYKRLTNAMRLRFMFFRFTAAIGSIAIPILNNIPLTWRGIDWAKGGTTFLGFVVALAIAAEGILKYRERMPAFSRIARSLESELTFFQTGAKEYHSKDEDEAFRMLVERCEEAFTTMKESTLDALTRTEDTSHR
jgi:hypothetical protein